jgi:hypothetical protein
LPVDDDSADLAVGARADRPRDGGDRGGGSDADSLVDAAATALLLKLGIDDWTVPAVALGVPGLLLILGVALQVVTGAAWIPVARRSMAGVGVRRRSGTSDPK